MPLYLAPFERVSSPIGTVFRPVGMEPGGTFIDLRADGGATLEGNGLNACLLFLPGATSNPALDLLGTDMAEPLALATKSTALSKLGVDVQSLTLGGLVRDLLLSPPVNGWKPVRADRRGITDIYLGGSKVYTSAGAASVDTITDLLVDEQVAVDFMRGDRRRRWRLWQIFGFGGLGAALSLWSPDALWLAVAALPATDAFTNTTGVDLTVHSASWSLVTGNMEISANAVGTLNGASGNVNAARWNADTFSDDQYSKCTLVAAGGGNYIGPGVRESAGAVSFYYYFSAVGDQKYVGKVVSGSITDLASHATVLAVSDLLELRCEGSTITARLNGANDPNLSGNPFTDTALASGSAGLAGYNAHDSSLVDNWEGGNLGGGHPTARRHSGIPGMSLTGRRTW